MLPYLVFLAGLAAVSVCSSLMLEVRVAHNPVLKEEYNKRRSQGFAIFCALALVVFTGLRATGIGADTQVYINAVKDYYGISFTEAFIPSMKYPYDFEIGYIYLTKLSAWLGLSPTLFLTIVSAIIYIPTMRYIRKNTRYVFTSVLVYFAFGFFTLSLGIFRQFIAMSIVMAGLKYIEQKKFLRFCIAILIAMLFHTTALIVFPLYFLSKLNFKKLIFLVLCAEVVFMVLGRRIIELALSLLPKYSGYVNSMYDVSGGSYLNLIFLNMVFIAYCLFADKPDKIGPKDKMILAQLVMAILCQCCAYHMGIFGRIVPYFSIVIIIAIPIIMERWSEKERRIYPVLWVGLYLVLLLLTLRELNGNKYITPFTFIWQ